MLLSCLRLLAAEPHIRTAWREPKPHSVAPRPVSLLFVLVVRQEPTSWTASSLKWASGMLLSTRMKWLPSQKDSVHNSSDPHHWSTTIHSFVGQSTQVEEAPRLGTVGRVQPI